MNKAALIFTLALLPSLLFSQKARFKSTYIGSYENVSTTSPWQAHRLLLGIEKKRKYSIMLEGGYYQRFENEDLQIGLNNYINFSKKLYGSVSVKASNAVFLPQLDLSTSLYQVIGKNEISLGYRSIDFDEHIAVYNIGLARYWGKEYTSFRTYYSRPDFGNEDLWSFVLQHRHYFNDDQFLELLVAHGKETSRNIESLEIINLTNNALSLAFSRSFKKINVKLGAQFRKESFDSFSRNRLSLMLVLSSL